MRVTCLPTHVINKLLTTKSACMAEVIAAFVKRRNEIGLSQREISISIGVDDGLVSKWEIGNRRPSNFMMFNWAQALGVILTVEIPDGQNEQIEGSEGRERNRPLVYRRWFSSKENSTPTNL